MPCYFFISFHFTRLLQSVFEKALSDQSLINYVHIMENLLFEKTEAKHKDKFTIYNPRLRNYAFESMSKRIPSNYLFLES